MTDSELKRRWESLGERDDPEAAHERETIRREWREILVRKGKGELTDPARVDAVAKAMEEYLFLMGVTPVTIVKREARGRVVRDDFDDRAAIAHEPSPLWGVYAGYFGTDKVWTLERMLKLRHKVKAEMAAFPYVLANHTTVGGFRTWHLPSTTGVLPYRSSRRSRLGRAA